MTGMEIIGLIGIFGYVAEQVLAALPIKQNSSVEVAVSVLKAIGSLRRK